MAVEPIELAAGRAPRLALTATPDPMGGSTSHDGEPIFATAAVSAG